MNGIIILYYKYVTIENPHEIMAWIRLLCTKLHLKGRILISTEGINGTLGGMPEEIAEFTKVFLAHPLFQGTDIKESAGSADDFPRLMVKVKKEIVGMGIAPEALTVKDTGVHLTPEETHQLIATNKELVILDTRNDYESRIGKFTGAIIPPLKTFRDFPQYIEDNLESFKDKEVLMYCTGGVRCERATALLNVKKVAKKVYQIDGGICRYVEKYPDGFFRGKNYVFDDRIALPVNNDVLTDCDVCQKPADTYTNCMNTQCNVQFVACMPCREKFDYTCSQACHDAIVAGTVKPRKNKVGVITFAQSHQ
jgi:predicted sulfurtransferase